MRGVVENNAAGVLLCRVLHVPVATCTPAFPAEGLGDHLDGGLEIVLGLSQWWLLLLCCWCCVLQSSLEAEGLFYSIVGRWWSTGLVPHQAVRSGQ